MSNWENKIIAKANAEHSLLLDGLKNVPGVYPSNLPDYWPNVKAMMLRLIYLETTHKLEEGVRSGNFSRAEAHAWRKGAEFAAAVLASSSLEMAPAPEEEK